jgi:hypothetical protein
MPDPSEAPASIPNSALMLGNWVAFQEQDGGALPPALPALIRERIEPVDDADRFTKLGFVGTAGAPQRQKGRDF